MRTPVLMCRKFACCALLLASLYCSKVYAENTPRGSLVSEAGFQFDCNRGPKGLVLQERRYGIEVYASRSGTQKTFALRDKRGCTFFVTADSLEFEHYMQFGHLYNERPSGEVI
jgi:hypothetical protein